MKEPVPWPSTVGPEPAAEPESAHPVLPGSDPKPKRPRGEEPMCQLPAAQGQGCFERSASDACSARLGAR